MRLIRSISFPFTTSTSFRLVRFTSSTPFSKACISFGSVTSATSPACCSPVAMSYDVSERSREIGIRMALGADRAAVLGLVLRGGLQMAATGVS